MVTSGLPAMMVLVVEDDAEVREALEVELGDAGHEVTSVVDGGEALEFLRSRPDRLPDAILLDLMMPNMGGQAFRRRQLEDPRLAAIPTLVMTAKQVDAAVRSDLGEAPVLPKPFEASVLVAALLEMVQPHRQRKVCGCGLQYDEAGWRRLKRIGEIDNGRQVGERLELRLCTCKSTLAWQLGPHAVSVAVIRAARRS